MGIWCKATIADHPYFSQVGKGVGGLASGVWGGISGKNQKQDDTDAAKQEAAEGEEEEGQDEEEGQQQQGNESTTGKGSFF